MKHSYGLLLFLSAVCLLSAGCAKQPASDASSVQSDANQIPLSYTTDYVLFEGADTEIETKFLGLLDRTGKEILPAEYYGVSVAENGLIFAETDTGCQIFDGSGKPLGEPYRDISSQGANGMTSVCGITSQLTVAPFAPYIAYREGPDGKYQYYQLDKTGAATESEPYSDMDFSENGLLKCRDGILFTQAADGTVTQAGGEVTQTIFGGRYLAKSYYPNTHFTRLAIETPDGKQVLPAEYFGISEPFQDRLLLSKGAPEFLGGSQAFLFDENCKPLADDSNYYSFAVQPDSSYYGISRVGNPYDGYVEAVITDENGNPEPQGAYFVDKNGTRLSERYVDIEIYDNEAALQKQADMLNGASNEILSRIGGKESLSKITDAPGHGKVSPNEAFCLCQTSASEAVKIPLRDVLICDSTT